MFPLIWLLVNQLKSSLAVFCNDVVTKSAVLCDLYIVICCLYLPGPTLLKKINCEMLAHSPQTTFLRKTIYNVVWICLGQHYTRILPVQYWPMVNRQFFLAKWSTQCCAYQAGTTLHENIVYSMFSEYVWDNIQQENYLRNISPERTERIGCSFNYVW